MTLLLQIIGFFFVCLWMVPFSVFISLSANDMVLPTLGNADSNSGEKVVKKGLLAMTWVRK